MSLEINRKSVVYRLLELLGEDLFSVGVHPSPSIRVHLPNLRCRDLDFGLGGDQLRVYVTVENVGLARARACDVIATVDLTGPPQQTHHLQVRCPILDVGSSQRLDLGAIPNVAGDQFANVKVIVDPPTPAHPGGEVWESDKTDNICFNGIYTTPVQPGEPPSETPGTGPPEEPPIRTKRQES